jgi:AraC-binding-like domain
MAGSFATWQVDDPHDTTVSLSERFAPRPHETREFWARTYEAADWRRYKIDPDAHRTLVSVGLIGGGDAVVCISSFKDRAATKFYLKSPGLDFYCLSFIQEGSGELCQSGSRKPAQLDKESAAIYRTQPKTALLTSDRSARLNVWLPVALVRRHAASLFDGVDVGNIDFDTTIDCRAGAGASLRRLTEFLFSELARPDSLFCPSWQHRAHRRTSRARSPHGPVP